MDRRVLVAAVIGPFGVRGAVKLKTFTADPMTAASYGPLETEDGARRFEVAILQPPKGEIVMAQLTGIGDRNAAEAIKGVRLFASRLALPQLEDDEFYLADLIGLEAVDPAGQPLGTVTDVQNFGAGDLIEVAGRFFAFTRDVVPIVDLANRRLVIDPPAEIEP